MLKISFTLLIQYKVPSYVSKCLWNSLWSISWGTSRPAAPEPWTGIFRLSPKTGTSQWRLTKCLQFLHDGQVLWCRVGLAAPRQCTQTMLSVECEHFRSVPWQLMPSNLSSLVYKSHIPSRVAAGAFAFRRQSSCDRSIECKLRSLHHLIIGSACSCAC